MSQKFETMDERGKYLLGQLQFMERNVKALEEVVAKMLRIREEQENFNNVFAKSMHDIGAMEEAKSLAHCFNSLGDCGTTLVQDTHDIMIVRPEVEILQVLTQIQDWGVVPMKVRRILGRRDCGLRIGDHISVYSTIVKKQLKWSKSYKKNMMIKYLVMIKLQDAVLTR